MSKKKNIKVGQVEWNYSNPFVEAGECCGGYLLEIGKGWLYPNGSKSKARISNLLARARI